jgi:hypothetical protein
MGIEFDPNSYTYYHTSYTGPVVPREPVEAPPSEMDAVEVERMETSPPPEEVPPTTTVSDPAADIAAGEEPPPDPMQTPYDPAVGSLVDTVV